MAVRAKDRRKGGKFPRGPHRLSDEEVAADQRRRLIEAMIALAGQQGYAAATVAHIIAKAQVSRKTFYQHFVDRKDLLLSAFDMATAASIQEMELAAQRTGGPVRQLEALMGRLARLARKAPALSRWRRSRSRR